MTEDEFKAKFMDMAARVLGDNAERRAVRAGAGLADALVTSLTWRGLFSPR